MTTDARTRWLLGAIAAVFLIALAGGAWFYRAQEKVVRQSVEGELDAIARLKVNEIARWRYERMGDANILLHSTYFVEGAARFLAHPNPDDTQAILTRFRALREHYGYSEVLLVSPEGDIRLSTSGDAGQIHACVLPVLAEALRRQGPAIADLHSGGREPDPHISFIAPLQSIGAVILICDARDFLFPAVQLWPTPSHTAETLLVRRDGDSVIFLNELRHLSRTALQLRIPLTETSVPAVQAVLGREGVVYGTDYRGVRVVSVLRRVPQSPWFMVAKVDEEEVFAGWRFRSALILGLTLASLAFIVALAGVIWQKNATAQVEALLREEKARHETEERYRITLMSVGDGVMVADVEGRVRLLNPVAEILTGWRQDDARGRPLEDVFRIVNEETRAVVENPVRRVVREGLVVGLANHTVLIARDGSERAIADSGAPIRDADGVLSGVVLVFRDQTEARAAERALESERANIKAIITASPVGLLVLDEKEQIVDANPAAERLLNKKLTDLRNRRCGDLISCPHAHEDPRGCGNSPACPACPILSAIRNVLATGAPALDREAEVPPGPTGSLLPRWLRFSVQSVSLDGRRHAVVAIDDLTAAKQTAAEIRRLLAQGERDRQALLGILEDTKLAQQALRENEGRFRSLLNGIPDMAWLKSAEGRFIAVNEPFARSCGRTPDEVVGKTDQDIWPRETGERYEDDDRQVMEAGLPRRTEERLVTEGAPPQWIETIKTPIRDASGRIVGTSGIARDITERKAAEAAIQQQLVELRRWHAAMLGREARVIDLKREVNAILTSMGQPARYESVDRKEGGSP